MISAIVDGGRGEPVRLLIRPADEAGARALLGAAAAHVTFVNGPYGDVWLRDTGPIFLQGTHSLLAATFSWNGWGGKYLMPGDEHVADLVATCAGVRGARFDLVLEGGAIEVDGTGALLTTRQCLLEGNRNPHLSAEQTEAYLRWSLGVTDIVWVQRGLINDHTDGHIDTIVRYVAPGVVACMAPVTPADPNGDRLHAIISDLRNARPHGKPLEVFTVPSPGAVLDNTGALMPASYMNFVITNTRVIVPIYGTPQDDAATKAIAALFPTRQTVPLMCRDILVGGGGFHCTTQQQPKDLS